jgi:ATP-dependent DNA helicase DinG
LPLLADLLDRPFNAVTLKGVSNYVCRRRFRQASSQRVLGLVRDAGFDELRAWVGDTDRGDRAEVSWLPDSAPIWSQITTGPDGRLGSKCPFFEQCFVTRARRAAEKADLILVNHHLLFADLALRSRFAGARVLPDADAVILDEAHQIEGVATEHFGVDVSTTATAQLVAECTADGDDSLARMARHVERCATTLFSAARHRLRLDDLESSKAELPPELFEADDLREAWFHLDTALEEVSAHTALRAERCEGENAERFYSMSRRAQVHRDSLATIAEMSDRGYVSWGQANGPRVALHASPIDVGPLIRRELVDRFGAAVFTSATLTVSKSFRYARQQLGLGIETADELCVDSPFDYARQAVLYLPRDLPDPRDARYFPAATDRIVELLEITTGRAFVLFTSHRALREVAARLPEKTSKYALFIQGQAPRASLLTQFQSTADAVLLATGGFWEGVDVPGEALSQVIIDKLPFAPPNDPLVKARSERVAELGRDPFADYQVPQAAIALRQGFGRLIRRRDDRGIVSILDRRVLAKAYGREFVASLPSGLARTASIEQVRRWWSQ